MSTLFTVAVTDQTAARLRERAEAEGTTAEAVAAAELDRPPRKSETDPLMRLAGMFESDVPDAADRHDEYLGQALYDETAGRAEAPNVR